MSSEMTIGFIGNPNCGKTTLFNAYTGANLKVANWPGVTVEKVEGAGDTSTTWTYTSWTSRAPIQPHKHTRWRRRCRGNFILCGRGGCDNKRCGRERARAQPVPHLAALGVGQARGYGAEHDGHCGEARHGDRYAPLPGDAWAYPLCRCRRARGAGLTYLLHAALHHKGQTTAGQAYTRRTAR